jgi:curved DNA-binding protein CbpA
MKDYYYILGLKQTATPEEIKKAYRKLSIKFHPDKNDGDEFFTERFKEIQEAYETLIDTTKRQKYDSHGKFSSYREQNNSGAYFNPDIEYFKSNKNSFEYNEEISFSWKTINADKVILNPFGIVQPIGQKTYRIKDFKHKSVTFELIAENSNIGRQIKSSLTLTNRTYKELYIHFKKKIREEDQKAYTNSHSDTEETKTSANRDNINNPILTWFFIILVLVILYIVLGLTS